MVMVVGRVRRGDLRVGCVNSGDKNGIFRGGRVVRESGGMAGG